MLAHSSREIGRGSLIDMCLMPSLHTQEHAGSLLWSSLRAAAGEVCHSEREILRSLAKACAGSPQQ